MEKQRAIKSASEKVEDSTLRETLKALINDELNAVTKAKTLDAILSYARIARSREQRTG